MYTSAARLAPVYLMGWIYCLVPKLATKTVCPRFSTVRAALNWWLGIGAAAAHTLSVINLKPFPPCCEAVVGALRDGKIFMKEGVTAPLKLRKTNRRAQTKFHCRCYLWVYGDQKIWKLKISDEGFLSFPIFWKKNWKKNFKKKFFFTKICFSELEKAYVQLFVLNFFLSRS